MAEEEGLFAGGELAADENVDVGEVATGGFKIDADGNLGGYGYEGCVGGVGEVELKVMAGWREGGFAGGGGL